MNASQLKREVFFKSAVGFYNSASQCAEAGDLQSAASFILKALEQERKASIVGPQVLQLIKPKL